MDFHKFYGIWFDQLDHLVHQLTDPKPPDPQVLDHHRRGLVHKVMTHYTEYYRVKSLAANHDVLSMFAARWCTAVERSLHWIAGWRPTTAFHIIYTESSVDFESRLFDNILRGVHDGNLGDLSSDQFARVSDLQCETVHEENAINDLLSEWQVGTCELIGICAVDAEREVAGLVKILEKADDLRLRTIRGVVELLTTQQAAEFLIVAARLQLGIHKWGLEHESACG